LNSLNAWLLTHSRGIKFQVLVLTPVIPAAQEAEIRRITVQSQPRANSSETLSRKKPSHKRAGGVAPGAECLFGKHEAVISNPNTAKKRKKKKKELQGTFLSRSSPLPLLNQHALKTPAKHGT
jgi:hypothetical protein